jgi:hypothetical protein
MGKATNFHLLKGLAAALLGALALGSAGCAMDDVQFNGGVFDMVGLSDSARATAKTGDPKVAERAPLVVPPTTDRLPVPGEQAPPDQVAAINDPDKVQAVNKAELQRKQTEYCRVNYEQAMARGDETTALNAAGPLGPCRPSVLNGMKAWNSSEDATASQ